MHATYQQGSHPALAGAAVQVATSRATHIWEHHQETDDEFEACFHDTMSQNRATPHDWQSSEHSMQVTALHCKQQSGGHAQLCSSAAWAEPHSAQHMQASRPQLCSTYQLQLRQC